MNAAWQIIVDFVSGQLAPQDFARKLKSESSLRELLSDPPFDWQLPFKNCSPLQVLEGLNLGLPTEAYKAQGILVYILDALHRPYVWTNKHYELCNIIELSLPRWLNVDEQYVVEHYLVQYLLAMPQDLELRELFHWIRERLQKDFRYHVLPPSWIEKAEPWPIGENGPYVFVGQVNLRGHTSNKPEAGFYVFVDAVTRETKTLIQGYDPQANYQPKAKQ